MATIKQIKVSTSTVPYDISAKYILSNAGAEMTWEDITALVKSGFTMKVVWTNADYASATAPTAAKLATVPAGVVVYYNSGSSTATGTLAASEDTAKHMHLIYHPHGGKDSYDEYVSFERAEGEYAWEKIGNTDIDLSGYVAKGVTYPGAAVSGGSGSTEAAGAATVTSSKQSAYNADVDFTGTTISVAYERANTATGSAGAGEAANTGEAGAINVTPTFTGTAATISMEIEGAELQDHSYQPAGTIGGSQFINSHTHGMTLTKSTITYVSDASLNAGTFTQGTDSFTANNPTEIDVTKLNGGSFTQGSKASFTQGSKASFTQGSKASWTSTVVDGLLSFTFAANGDDTFVANGNDTFVANGNDTFTPASLDEGFYTPGTPATFSQGTDSISFPTLSKTPGTATYVENAYVIDGGAATISGSNFSFTGTTATISHTVGSTVTSTISTNYTPAGTISNISIAAHSHSYTKPTAHMHQIQMATISATVSATLSATAAILEHSHTVEIANHTHTIGNHTHDVFVARA